MPNSPLSWEIESKKIWLKQPKAASALDFSYFQRVSKLVTHDRKVLKSQDFRTFFALFLPDNLLAVFSDPNADPNGTGSGKHQTARERILPIVFAASRLAEVVT